MDYEHDLFISYSRTGATHTWLKNIFVPVLEERLEFALGRPASIFFDDKVRSGGTWPVEIGQALGASRAMLALWSRPFLNSDWCAREMAIMRAREEAFGMRSPANSDGLIAIWTIHNGPPPGPLALIQNIEIVPYFNTRMRPDSARMEDFYEQICAEETDLAAMIDAAPPFDPNWPSGAAEAFFEEFHRAEHLSQDTNPRYTS